jgi:microcystin-dependent protein
MPFIIPNATDIDGSKFIALDQAEPDSLDFQILGDRSTGVLSGCAVSTVSQNTVGVTAGWVTIQGVVYKLATTPQLELPTAPITTTYRFDVVVARLDSDTGTVSVVAISGPESTTNPTFPKTPSRLNSLVGASYINIGNIIENNVTTDVVLATVFRNAAAAISNACIVDKRVNVPSTTSLRGLNNPDNTIGNDGDLYYRTTVVTSSSGVFIKTNGTWVELLLQDTSGSVTPIGSIIMWPSNTSSPNPVGKTFWLECNGAYVGNSNYAALKTLLQETYGPYVGSTFKLPNLSSGFIQGSGTAGSTGGSTSVPIIEDNLPAHKHTLNNHSHTVGDHQHTMTHTHVSQTTELEGAHSHLGNTQDGLTPAGFVTRLGNFTTGTTEIGGSTIYGKTGFVAPYSSGGDGVADGLYNTDTQGALGAPVTGMQVHYTPGLANSPTHKHPIIFNEYSGNSGSPTNLTVSTGPNNDNTGNTGNNIPLVVTPPYITMRWFIRAL